jgi:hypothetical protein
VTSNATLDGYALALRDSTGPVQRAFRVVPRYADLRPVGGGASIEIARGARPQAVADDLRESAPQLLRSPSLATEKVLANLEPECTPRRGLALIVFAALRISRWGLPRGDLVAADPDGLALAHAGPLAGALITTPEMRMRLLLLFAINGIDAPDWLVDAVVPDCTGHNPVRSHRSSRVRR